MNATTAPSRRVTSQGCQYDWRPVLAAALDNLSLPPVRAGWNPDVQTIAHVCAHNPDASAYAATRFDSGNASLKAGIIAAFYEPSCEVPTSLQIRFVAYAESCLIHEGDPAFDAAVLTLSRCAQVRGRAAVVLERCLHSDAWWHRGNAAISLAMLGDVSATAMQRIGQLIHDNDGNMDWSVRSSALRAIAMLGRHAQTLVQELHLLAGRIEYTEQFCGCDGELLANALSATGDASADTIGVLIEMVGRGGFGVPWAAIFALGEIAERATLAGQTEAAMRVIAHYAESEDSKEFLDDHADRLQIAMLAIGGADHPECRRIHAYLRSIAWLDPARHIAPFVHIFDQH